MNVNILTSGYWPSYPIIDAKMPGELNDYQQVHVFMVTCPPSTNIQAVAVPTLIVSCFPYMSNQRDGYVQYTRRHARGGVQIIVVPQSPVRPQSL